MCKKKNNWKMGNHVGGRAFFFDGGKSHSTGLLCPQLLDPCLSLHRSSVLRPQPAPEGPSYRPLSDWVFFSEPWVQMWSQIPLCLECAPLCSAGLETTKEFNGNILQAN